MADKKTSLVVDPEIWRKAKHRALDEGISLGELLDRALRDYLRRKPNKPAGRGKETGR